VVALGIKEFHFACGHENIKLKGNVGCLATWGFGVAAADSIGMISSAQKDLVTVTIAIYGMIHSISSGYTIPTGVNKWACMESTETEAFYWIL